MRSLFRICTAFLSACFFFVPLSSTAAADSGYRTVIEDNEDLLSAQEESVLLADMQEFAQYGNAAVVTVSQYSSTERYAKEKYAELFGTENGLLFVIDMGERMIWLHSQGSVYRTINKSYANTITDNVYLYATDGDYLSCCREVFRQATTLMEGGRIAQPMKYISNALIALVAALLINFMILSTNRDHVAEDADAAVAAMTTATGINVLYRRMTKQKVSEHYESSGGGGGSSGGGGGGGFSGGGGSSGGGGGHRF